MLRKEKEGVEWLEFKRLQDFPEIAHGVFLKGCSDLNFSSTHDSPKKITLNRRRVGEILGVNHLIFANGVHGSDVMTIDSSFPPNTSFDGMISSKSGIALAATHADCQIALFFDPTSGWISCVHAGWKGQMKKIYSVTIDALEKKGVNPKNLIACISPSLGPTVSEFINYRDEFPSPFWTYRKERSFFNLWEIAEDELLSKGLLKENIEIAKLCTHQNEGDFFSYRRDQTKGRNVTVIAKIN